LTFAFTHCRHRVFIDGTNQQSERERSAEESIWTKERGSDRRMERPHIEELRTLHSSSNIVSMAKSRRLKWARER
jgi:hypothetical protein